MQFKDLLGFRHLGLWVSIFSLFTLTTLNTYASNTRQAVSVLDSTQTIAELTEQQEFVQVLNQLNHKPFTGNINATTKDGSSALLWACYFDQTALAIKLLNQGADPNINNQYGISPLSQAVLNGNTELTMALMKQKADSKLRLAGQETLLMLAARTGKVEIVNAFISAGIAVNAVDSKNQTALMWASAEGHVAIVDALLNANADPNITTEGQFTALMFAVRQAQTKVVKRLLAAGVDVNSVMIHNKKGRRWAPSGSSALMVAINNAHFELATELLKAGADPNDLRSGFAPLHGLVWVRKPDLGDNSDLPAKGAGEMSSLEFAEQLIKQGANPNLKITKSHTRKGASVSLEGATPLFVAAKTADLPFIKLMVKHGGDLKTVNEDNVNLLMMAAGLGTHAADEEVGSESEALALIDYLVAHQLDINAISKNGETAMHGAAYKNFPKVIEHLNKLGANVDIWHQKNKYGWTPLLIAQGFRPGNYKPSEKTEQALINVLKSHAIIAEAAPSRSQKKTYLAE